MANAEALKITFFQKKGPKLKKNLIFLKKKALSMKNRFLQFVGIKEQKIRHMMA